MLPISGLLLLLLLELEAELLEFVLLLLVDIVICAVLLEFV